MIPNPQRTYAEAIDRLIADMAPENRQALRELAEEDLITQHFGIALYARNNYSLWSGNSHLLESCAKQAGSAGSSWHFMDPDGASNLIVRGAWEKMRRVGVNR